MTLLNQHWIGYDGAPLTGATPPVLRVHGARVMTPAQSGSVAHAYKLFSTVVASSPLPNGYHVQHRTLRDGSKVQLSSNNGQHLVDVWPAGGEGKPPEFARGFAVRPIWAGGAEAVWPDRATLVRYDTTGADWEKWVSPYRLGKEVRPTYFLDAGKRSKPKGVVVKAETNFADVYSMTPSGSLYLNGLPLKGLGAGTHGMPVLVRDTNVPVPNTSWFVIDDDKTSHVVESPTETTRVTVFDKAASFSPTAGSSLEYNAGARYTESANRTDYLRVLITAAGATQTWRASVTLQPTAPWVSSTGGVFQQMDAPVALVYRGGYMTASGYRPTAPFVPLNDNNAMFIGAGIYAFVMRAIYDRSVNTISASLSDGGSIALYPGITGEVSRSVSISAALEQGLGMWMGEWPTNRPGVWTATSIPTIEEKGQYSFYKTPFDGPDSRGVFAGDLVTSVLTESGGEVRVFDQATSNTTADGKQLFSSAVSHSFRAVKVEAYEHGSVPWTGAPNHNVPVYSFPFFEPVHCIGDVCYGGWVEHYASTGWREQVFVSKVTPNQGDLYRMTWEDYSVQASARDYIYYDKENSTYLYVESTLTGGNSFSSVFVDRGNGNITDGSSTTGSMTVSVRLKLESPQGNKEVEVHAVSFSYAPKIDLILPADLPQNTDFTWKHAHPGAAPPIFIPKWFNQGGCPHIAYTTAAEAASAAAHEPPLSFEHRFAASFRLRMIFRSRPPFAAVPYVPEADEVDLPMLEAMLIAHFPGIPYYEFAELESKALVLNASFPGTLLPDIGLPAADTLAEVYRT